MKPPKHIIEALVGKAINCNVTDGRDITIEEVWDFVPEDRDIGLYSPFAECVSSEGNEIGVFGNGDVFDTDDNLIATIESDFGIRDNFSIRD